MAGPLGNRARCGPRRRHLGSRFPCNGLGGADAQHGTANAWRDVRQGRRRLDGRRRPRGRGGGGRGIRAERGESRATPEGSSLRQHGRERTRLHASGRHGLLSGRACSFDDDIGAPLLDASGVSDTIRHTSTFGFSSTPRPYNRLHPVALAGGKHALASDRVATKEYIRDESCRSKRRSLHRPFG